MHLVWAPPGDLWAPHMIGWKAATFITLAAFGFLLVMIWLA